MARSQVFQVFSKHEKTPYNIVIMLFSYILGYSRKGNNQNRKQKSNADQLKLLNWPLSCCLSSSVQMIVTIEKVSSQDDDLGELP